MTLSHSMLAIEISEPGGPDVLKPTSVPVPEFAELEEMRAALMEAVAETDEELLEQFIQQRPALVFRSGV